MPKPPAEKQLVDVANALPNGEIDLLEGIRRITKLRWQTDDPESEEFLSFVAIDSETDHWPTGRVRLEYNPARLAEIDEEIARYMAASRDDITSACHQLASLPPPR
jgi:hypothetical protein